jgi:hypothetical protein
VAINGKPWANWFDELYEYAVISNGTAIGVRIGQKWTIAVDGVPWTQRFDRIRDYTIFPNGSVVAAVETGGRNIIVRDGVEDPRLPNPHFIRMNERGKIAWYSQFQDHANVTVGYTSTWTTAFAKILGLVVARDTGRVAAQVSAHAQSTVVLDDLPWTHWYNSDVPGVGICHSSVYMRVFENGLWTLAVNDKSWTNWFDELSPIGCEQSGAVSVAVKKNGKWAVVRNGKIVTDWFADLRGWAINPEGNFLAAAVAEQERDGTLSWKVIVSPLVQ